MNVFLELEYVGTNYFGFQLQNKKDKREITVQRVLESALAKLFRRKIRVAFSSRTDRGVHAKAQGINFNVDTKIPLKNIKRALNSFLPDDVGVKKVKIVPLNFQARFSVKSKIYRYIILNRSDFSVFWANFAWQINGRLKIEDMKKCAKKLIGKKDFSLFAKDAHEYKDCTREMKDIRIKKRGSFIYIDLEATGFLRNMARNIVSFLVRVGQGKMSLKEASLVIKKQIPYINKPAPAGGLYLTKVRYK